MFKVTNYRLLGFLFSIKRDYMYVINLFSAYFSKELDEPITTQLPSNADTEPQYTHHFLVKRRWVRRKQWQWQARTQLWVKVD